MAGARAVNFRGDPEHDGIRALESSELDAHARAISAGHRAMANKERARGNTLLAEFHNRMAGAVFKVQREVEGG